MRPPRIAAEYLEYDGTHLQLTDASMRPPRIAAEYGMGRATGAGYGGSFNEAAANRGGIRGKTKTTYVTEVLLQ